MSASPASDTRRKTSKKDETMSPLSNPTTTFPPASTPSAETAGCAVPSIPAPAAGEQRNTVPGLPRSRSSRSKPPVPPPTSRHASDPGHTSSGTTSTRSSVVFPGSNSTSTATTPSLGSPDLGASSPDIGTDPDAHPQRPRYHSALSRSASKMSFTGKLQSLRKKIESELSRKRPGGSRQQSSQQGQGAGNGSKSSRKAQKGTVAGLKPSPALTVPESMTVADASQLCAAKRTDCVLVVDDEEGLSGIFTAKDLAFRVTAEGLDPRITPVSEIMTRNPMVTRDTTSATEALQLMVSKHFRHLPVCNDDGDVVGLLDITKVFHEALAKVERGSTATSQLSAALAGVQSELGPGIAGNPQAAAMLAYVDALRDRMALPDLTTVIDARQAPPVVGPRTSVKEAAKLMKERRTTAVCVMEANSGTSAVSGLSNGGHPKIAGIFTSKDIVLRVIAAGLDAPRCSVVRVMTPHPDTAPPDMVVQDALKKMHNGHYLNLPVVDNDGKLVAIVDVLKLTYATLEQMENMADDKTDNSGGPMWGKFFETLNAANDDDTASVISASDRPDTPSRERPAGMHHRGMSSMTSPISELKPDDSASVVESDSGARRGGAESSVAPSLPIDDGTYVFKFRTPSGRTHRFQARHDSYELLRDIVAGKLSSDPFFTPIPAVAEGEAPTAGPDAEHFSLSYTDDEGDSVTMTADSDVTDAVRIARGQKSDRVVLLVDGGKAWEDHARLLGGEGAVEKLKTVETSTAPVPGELDPVKEVEEKGDPAEKATYGQEGVVHATHNPVGEAPKSVRHARGSVGDDGEKVMGIPKDLVLPAAIGFLGVVILGVFVASRSSK